MANTISIPRERFIDASGYSSLSTWIQEFLSNRKACTDLATLRQFLRNEFKVTTDLAVMSDKSSTVSGNWLTVWQVVKRGFHRHPALSAFSRLPDRAR